MTPSNEHDAAKEGEPVRRWTGWRTTLCINRHGSVVQTWEPNSEAVDVMLVADHEAALLAARQVDEAMVERAAKGAWCAIGRRMEQRGYQSTAWEAADEPIRWSMREEARAALLAALNEPEGEQ